MALVRKIPMKNYYNPNNNSSNAYVKIKNIDIEVM